MLPHEHVWVPETQYRPRRCKECGAHHEDDALKRVRARAHVHKGDGSGRPQPLGSCYGEYETCGEHHAHDDTCGGRALICGRKEDRDLVAIVALVDRLQAQLKSAVEARVLVNGSDGTIPQPCEVCGGSKRVCGRCGRNENSHTHGEVWLSMACPRCTPIASTKRVCQ